MNFKEYQEKSRKTAIYPEAGNTFYYPILGLNGEVGECAEKVKKLLRDESVTKPSELTETQRNELAKEFGDVLWYLTQLCTECGISLESVAKNNIEKLYSRLERNEIKGTGDNR